MGFGAPLLYFLMYRLYLNLIWVKILRKRLFTIFVCVVLMLVRLFSGSQANQVGQAVFSPCLGEENSDNVETSGPREGVRIYCFQSKNSEHLSAALAVHAKGSRTRQRFVFLPEVCVWCTNTLTDTEKHERETSLPCIYKYQ